MSIFENVATYIKLDSNHISAHPFYCNGSVVPGSVWGPDLDDA